MAAGLLPTAARRYPALDGRTWYPVVREELLGYFLQASREVFVFRAHVEVRKSMSVESRWNFLVRLDEELLTGGVMLPEWCVVICRDADTAYASGAFLSSILAAVAAVEAYLRAEQGAGSQIRLVQLIEASDLEPDLKATLHHLRRYRNEWVHLKDPWDDDKPLRRQEELEAEVELMAELAARAMRQTLYAYPWL